MVNIHLSPPKILSIYVALFALFVITSISVMSFWYEDFKLVHEEISMPLTRIKKDDTKTLITKIPDNHLFGKSFAKIGEVPLTQLQIHVTGIVKVNVENNHAYSKAYISVSGEPSKIYQVGDTLPSGVKIYNITAHEVILENGGQLEKLPLPRASLQFKPRSFSGVS